MLWYNVLVALSAYLCCPRINKINKNCPILDSAVSEKRKKYKQKIQHGERKLSLTKFSTIKISQPLNHKPVLRVEMRIINFDSISVWNHHGEFVMYVRSTLFNICFSSKLGKSKSSGVDSWRCLYVACSVSSASHVFPSSSSLCNFPIHLITR